ncbi:uncharacterized protein BDW43DRAFT_285804 [Aspergillus alliaceus]|uniref:uncharacterized protein n=1 Tax=Petromyces alliaceus TaxID=209559 RepID=UPI0012A4C205|nr:uncharacterized protein BDW43DRAFT_285804 [Aspergillus alliaceus]KAB8230356.1 hypothetical protein BDW43DRAFT_285804 [Aspergillus alliaceus]
MYLPHMPTTHQENRNDEHMTSSRSSPMDVCSISRNGLGHLSHNTSSTRKPRRRVIRL